MSAAAGYSSVPRGGVTDADMIRCRVARHMWDDFEPTEMRSPSWGTRVSFRCLRCASERHDVYDSLGEVGYRRYIYVEGYQYAKGERPSAAEFRVMLMKEQRRERRRAREAKTAKKRTPAKRRLHSVR